MPVDERLQNPNQSRKIGSARPAMDDGRERGSITRRIERAHECRRCGAQPLAHGFDRGHDGGHATERETGGNEGDDLPVVCGSVAPDNLDWIERRFRMVEGRVEMVQRRLESRTTGASRRSLDGGGR